MSWYNEPRRHALSAKGVKTAVEGKPLNKVPKAHEYAEETGFSSSWLRDFEKEHGKITDVMTGDQRGMVIETEEGEYLVYEDYNSAERAAQEEVERMLEEMPESFDRDFIKNHTSLSDTDRRLIAQDMTDGYVDDIRYEDDGERVCEEARMLDEYNDICDKVDAEEDDEKREKLEEEKEEVIDEATEKLREEMYDDHYDRLSDPYDYFVEQEGLYNSEDFFKQYPNAIDIEEAAEEAVNIDGVAHFLSTYDGEEKEFKGKYLYRVN